MRDADGFVVDRRQPARRFKLSYLLTVWTQRPEDEHRLLSAALSCFVALDALPPELLQGELAEQREAIRMTIALPRPPDRPISDVWTALGGELKACLDLIVTVPIQSGRHQKVGPLVREEPRISFSGSKGQAEGPRGNGKPAGDQAPAGGGASPAASGSPASGPPADQGPPPAARPVPGLGEVAHAGKEGTGRSFGMRVLPRPPRQ